MDVPIIINKKNVEVIIIGAGDVGYKKAYKFLKNEFDVTVIGDKINNNFLIWKNCKIVKSKYKPELLKSKDKSILVIAVTDSILLNIQICSDAKNRGLFYINGSEGEKSSANLMSFLKRKNLIISVYTFGKSPSISKNIISQIDDFIDNDIDERIEILGNIRKKVKKMNISYDKRKIFLNNIINLDLVELKKILERDGEEFFL